MKPKKINPDDVQIGTNIRAIRMARGISQEKLGEALGVTFQQVQKNEKGTNRVSGGRLIQICKALDCTLDELFSGTESSDAKPIGLPALSAQAARLATAFERIKSPSVRAKIMQLVASLADDADPDTTEAA